MPTLGGPCPMATEVASVCGSPEPPGHSALEACWTLGLGGRAALSLLFWPCPAALRNVAWALSWGTATGGGRLVGRSVSPLQQPFLLSRTSLCFETDVKSRAAGGRGPAPGPQGRRNMEKLAVSQHEQEDGHGVVWPGDPSKLPGRGAREDQGSGPALLRRRIPRPAGASERLESWPSWASSPAREAMADKGWSQLPEHSKSRQASASSSGFPGLRIRHSLGRCLQLTATPVPEGLGAAASPSGVHWGGGAVGVCVTTAV